MDTLEKGDKCPECGRGIMVFGPVENCTCHINPPCNACVENPLICSICGFTEEDPDLLSVL